VKKLWPADAGVFNADSCLLHIAGVVLRNYFSFNAGKFQVSIRHKLSSCSGFQ